MNVSSTSIEPGKSATLTVQLEPQTRGLIEKTVNIASNDPSGPLRRIVVRAEVQPDVHEASGLNIRKSFFSQECRPCHADKGMGKMGQELFNADCALCHGSLNERNHRRALNGVELAKDLVELRKRIAAGTGRGTPHGFSTAVGGPLSEAQINSLVDLFKKWQVNKMEKKKHNRRIDD